MKLSVLERVTLLSILPEQGNFVTLKILRKLRESLAFDETEAKALSISQVDDRLTWNAQADTGKEIQIGEKASDIIVAALTKLNDENKLTEQHYSLYELFVAGNACSQ